MGHPLTLGQADPEKSDIKSLNQSQHIFKIKEKMQLISNLKCWNFVGKRFILRVSTKLKRIIFWNIKI